MFDAKRKSRPKHSFVCPVQVAKGGEADDALKRVILDFHSNQLAAGKQAVIALLSGKQERKLRILLV